MRNLHNLLFLFLCLAFSSNALADACPKYLMSQFETEVSSAEKALDQIRRWTLTSHVADRDEIGVLQVPPEILNTYMLSGNSKGQLVYQHSQKVIKTTPDLILIGIWNLKNEKPENLYGFLDPTNVQSDQKHSSFNSNQPVMSAWSLETENGYISKISDNSGHYRPSPLHVYLALKKFESVGVDIRNTTVVLGSSLRVIQNLTISADNFIKSIESLNSTDYEKLKSPLIHLEFVLKFIYTNTEDVFTKNLIDLLSFRNSSSIDYNRLKKIVKMFNDQELNPIHIDILLDAIFMKHHYLFKGKLNFNKNPNTTDDIRKKLKSFILDTLAEEKDRLSSIGSAESLDDLIHLETVIKSVNSWFAWNRI